MKIFEIIAETTQQKIPARQQNATVGLNLFGDAERMNGDYTLNRVMMAVACSDGTSPLNMNAKSWVGKSKAAFPYSKIEQEMLKQAYQAAGASYTDLNDGDLHSGEIDSVNIASPVKPRGAIKKLK